MRLPAVIFGLLLAAGFLVLSRAVPAPATLRFEPHELPFVLANSETAEKHLPETMPGGIAVFDFDSDGRPDIYFTNGAEMPSLKKTSPKYWNRLYRNDGRGGFEDVTRKAGVEGTGYDIGAAVGDYDNDGHPDLFVAGVDHNTLYRNNGDGTFTDVTARAGLDRADRRYGRMWSVAGAWLDFDNDGKLDLFVVNYCIWDPRREQPCIVDGKRDYCHPKLYEGLPNSLYRNNGDGTFTDVSDSAGIRAHIGKGMSAAVADFDQDGRPDIFVTNDKVFNFLFHNEGNGRFREVAFDAGVAVSDDGAPVSAMGVDFRDINNDGLPDLFYTALPDETFPLFLNLGKGQFEEATHASRLSVLTRRMAGWGAGIVDLDNDGSKDIFVARSEVLSSTGGRAGRAKQVNSVFRNLGNGKFEDATAPAGFGARSPEMYRGAAFGDFNADGRMDLVVSALNAPAEIWLNTGREGNHWLDVKLTGSRGNRDAIGARIRITTRTGSQFNHVTTAVGYASSSTGPVHFGLGKDAVAELIEVSWPSGQVQRLTNVKADRLVPVTEPDGPTP